MGYVCFYYRFKLNASNNGNSNNGNFNNWNLNNENSMNVNSSQSAPSVSKWQNVVESYFSIFIMLYSIGFAIWSIFLLLGLEFYWVFLLNTILYGIVLSGIAASDAFHNNETVQNALFKCYHVKDHPDLHYRMKNGVREVRAGNGEWQQDMGQWTIG